MDNPENTEGAKKNGQSREPGNLGYTRQRQTKQIHSIIYVLDTTTCEQTQIA